MPSVVGSIWRWSQLLVALAVVIIEWLVRGVITIFFRVLPLPRSYSSNNDPKQSSVEDPDWERSTLEFIESRGYHTEGHFATTPDGYILGLHRIPTPHKPTSSDRDGADPNSPPTTPSDPPRPVLIIHGFMQSSEAFAIRRRTSDSLPLVLSDAGYDVWLGNNRGNKYSYKHVNKKPGNDDFWDYSLDDLCRYDLPTMVDYVLEHSGAKSLTLIGFSQGTAQSFAYLTNPVSASKVNLCIALAPVSVPRGFANPFVDTFARARPDFIFLLFGKRQLLPSTLFWRSYLPRDKFVKFIDYALKFLFGWDTQCLDTNEKPLLYSHLYSHTSVKAIVHWFQMIQHNKFQMFDDLMYNATPDNYSGYALPHYPLRNIRTPVACFCGGRDTLPQTANLLASLPKDKKVLVHSEEKYEHLDFMWAKDVSQKIYPKILTLMEKHNP